MPNYRNIHARKPRHFIFTIVILLSVSSFLLPAWAQTDLSELSDDELIDQRFRKDYREEFYRRLANYTVEEREAAMEKYEDFSNRRKFPQEFNGDELLDFVLHSDDANPVYKAVQELKSRYEGTSPEEHTALAELLQSEYRAAPYPILLPDTSNSAEFSANLAAYGRIDRTARELLPEELALKLFREVYLDSGQKGAITMFLLQINGEPFRGPATLAVLEELAEKVADWDARKVNAMGEHESLHGIIGNRLRPYADHSFEAIKARDWQKDSRDIYAMGRFDNPEARTLLLEYYDSLLKDFFHVEKRLRVLNALMVRWDREHDFEFRNLLRDELTEILREDHKGNLTYLMKAIESIEATGDPYFILHLERRRAELDLTEIRRASSLPQEYLDINIENTLKSFDRAIETLEAER
mgnify:CR=1 FL=1